MKVNKILGIFLEKSEDGKSYSIAAKDFEPALKNCCKEYMGFNYDKYLQDNLSKLQKDILIVAEHFNPDIIFFNIIKDEISPDTLNKLKLKYKTINWFSDDEWRWEGFSSYYCKYFTYCITTSKKALNKYKKIKYNNITLSSWGINKSKEEIEEHIDYLYDVSFIGTYSKEREKIINFLKQNDIKVICFGKGWKNGTISENKMKDVIYRSKINLNLSNSTFSFKDKIINIILKLSYNNIILSHIFSNIYLYINKDRRIDRFNKNFHNKIRYYRVRAALKVNEQIKARHFEIPANGGCQLSYNIKDIKDFFIPYKEIALFKDEKDCLYKINYLLYNDYERMALVREGHLKVRYKYSYDNIFNNIIGEVLNK